MLQKDGGRLRNRALWAILRQSPAGAAGRYGVVHGDMLPKPALLTTVPPFISHMATLPLVGFRHRMSDLPSPLKSPTPSTIQGDMLPKPTLLTTAPPFISHRATLPLVGFRHRMSDLPSPLKSPTAATTHGDM